MNILQSKKPCLIRSLLLFKWCVKHNLSVIIHIGVQKKMGGITGHSWIEFNKTPFKEPESTTQYTPMLTYSYSGRQFSPIQKVQ